MKKFNNKIENFLDFLNLYSIVIIIFWSSAVTIVAIEENLEFSFFLKENCIFDQEISYFLRLRKPSYYSKNLRKFLKTIESSYTSSIMEGGYRGGIEVTCKV